MKSLSLSGKVQTVLGALGPDQLGITSTHEHLLIDLRCIFQEPAELSKKGLAFAPVTLQNLGWVRYHWNSSLDNLQVCDEETAMAEANLYVRAGGRSLVDATSIGIGRDPKALARIARATGLNVIMGSSYYVSASHPKDMDNKTEAEIAEEVTRDLLAGAGDTGIRAGIIGEVGCSWPLTENERKVLRASATAQRQTGAPLLIHPGRNEAAPFEIVDILREAGADLSRTIMAHIERTIYDWKNLRALGAAGCYLEYDTFGHESSYYPLAATPMPNDAQRIDQIAFLISEGLTDQILLAQDMASKHRLTRYGGHGYHHLLENIIPRMRQHGIAREQIHTMLVENPKRVLVFA